MHKPDRITLFVTAGSAAIPVLIGATLICAHQRQTGLALLIGGVVPFLSSVILLLYDYRSRQKAIRGVIKVMLREAGIIFEVIKKDLKSAKSIHIVGNILYRDLFGEEKFNKILEERANDDFEIKICLYKPNNQYLRMRASDEITNYRIGRQHNNVKDVEQTGKENIERMNAEICRTLVKIQNLNLKLKRKIEVKYIEWTYILDSIIIIDEKIVVVDYLHQTGRGSPVFVLKSSPVCEAYRKEFERMWNYSGSEEL